MPDNGPATITVIRETERPVVDFVGGATYRPIVARRYRRGSADPNRHPDLTARLCDAGSFASLCRDADGDCRAGRGVARRRRGAGLAGTRRDGRIAGQSPAYLPGRRRRAAGHARHPHFRQAHRQLQRAAARLIPAPGRDRRERELTSINRRCPPLRHERHAGTIPSRACFSDARARFARCRRTARYLQHRTVLNGPRGRKEEACHVSSGAILWFASFALLGIAASDAAPPENADPALHGWFESLKAAGQRRLLLLDRRLPAGRVPPRRRRVRSLSRCEMGACAGRQGVARHLEPDGARHRVPLADQRHDPVFCAGERDLITQILGPRRKRLPFPDQPGHTGLRHSSHRGRDIWPTSAASTSRNRRGRA